MRCGVLPMRCAGRAARAGGGRMNRAPVPARGTDVRTRGTGIRKVCTGVLAVHPNIRLKWPVVHVDGTCVRLIRTGVHTVRTVAENIAMSQQRIPRADGNFDAYANYYYGAVENFYSVQGLDPALLAALKAALDAWNIAYPLHVRSQSAAQAARQTKDVAKRELERQIRPVSAFIQTYPKTTDADRATIGISVKDTGGTPTPPPISRPLLLVEAGRRLTHRLRIFDERAGEDGGASRPRKARPRGTLGAEVYVAVIAPQEQPPADMNRYKFVRTVTSGRAEVSFEPNQGGARAAYLVRWVSATGEPGPWAETTIATVAA